MSAAALQGASKAAQQGVRGVVVGYDGSAPAVAALRWAAEEAARRRAPLTVLYAADVDTDAERQLVLTDEAASAAALAVPQDAVDRLRSSGAPDVDARPLVHLGRPVDELVGASADADLVVVGNRGHGALANALLGSVAFSVTARAHCPVVVVREDPGRRPGPGCPVVVGVDGSRSAPPVLRFAAAAARSAGAPVTVVAAWTTPEVPAGDAVVPAYGEQVRRAARQRARDAADEAAAALETASPGTPVEVVVVEDAPARALATASRSAGLVVVGACGHGSLRGLFLGSVSHAVIRTAHSPVAVVPASGR